MTLGSRFLIPAAAATAFGAAWVLTPVASTVPTADVYYPGCDAVRAAGKAPLYRGQPGYRKAMDGDEDGIACEPHSERW